MQEILPDVLVETDLAGVTLGALRTERGTILIDSPLLARDGQNWRAASAKPGASAERLLVLLDEHYDRTIGARALRCTVIAHERASLAFNVRPNNLKIQVPRSGALWEQHDDLGAVHWVLPELTFTRTMLVHWGDPPLLLEHHPGPSKGSIWALQADKKVAFIGDTVTPGQPPFLASADLPVWLDTLGILLTARFRDYHIISGRGFLVSTDDIKAQQVLLKQVTKALQKMSAAGAGARELDIQTAALLENFKPRNRAEHELFRERLTWGLEQQYLNRFATQKADLDE